MGELGVLQSVRCFVAPAEQPGVVDVTFLCEERQRDLTFQGSTTQRGELACEAGCELPAVFGGPSTVAASIRQTLGQSREYSACLSTPRLLGQRLRGSFDVGQTVTDHTQASSYCEHSRGIHLSC